MLLAVNAHNRVLYNSVINFNRRKAIVSRSIINDKSLNSISL